NKDRLSPMRRMLQILCFSAAIVGLAGVKQREAFSIELFRNMVFIPVRVEGSGPLSFLLDTGTVGSIVSSRQAEVLHLKTEGKEKAYGVGDDTVYMSIAKDIALETSGVRTSRETIGVYPFNELDRRMGRRIDGVIGTSIFKDNVVDLDYSSRTISLFDPRRFSDS